MAVCLLTVAMPREKRLLPYRISRYTLAAGYILLSAACILAVHTSLVHAGKVGPLPLIITLSTAALQGVLFQHTMLALINPMSLTNKRVMSSLVPVAAVILVIIGTYIWGGERLFRIVFYAACGLYFMLLLIYLAVFRREYDDYEKAINDYFADDEGLHLGWISRAYYLAVAIGIAAGISLFLPAVPFIFFVGLVAVFYVYYAIRYIGYARIFPRMAPALEPVFDEVGGPQAGREEIVAKVAGWIAAKKFSQAGITLGSVSQELGLPRSALGMYIRRKGGRSFRQWINELRVDEAREVMIACQGMPLKEVGERVGFSSLRLFVRCFEAVEGEEPRYFQERVGPHPPVE